MCVCMYVDGDAETENQSMGMVWILNSGPSHKRSQVELVMSLFCDLHMMQHQSARRLSL